MVTTGLSSCGISLQYASAAKRGSQFGARHASARPSERASVSGVLAALIVVANNVHWLAVAREISTFDGVLSHPRGGSAVRSTLP